MVQLIMISDDLTGALDSAVFFADRGFKVVAVLNIEDLQLAIDIGAEVVAIVTGTREECPLTAQKKIDIICSFFKDFEGIIFKKIDSRLKGNIDAELSSLKKWFDRPLLVVPAIPRLGRFVRNGYLVGVGVSQPILIKQRIGLAKDIPDIGSEDEMDEILPTSLTEKIFVGSAGLAEAIARRLAKSVDFISNFKLNTPALFAIGSRDPITTAQLSYIANNSVMAAPNGMVPKSPKSDIVLIGITAGLQMDEADVVGRRFADGVADLVLENNITTLFGCGGETIQAVLKQLEIGVVEVIGEILPGVPVAKAINREKPLTIVTKSGGFGEPDLLEALINKFETKNL